MVLLTVVENKILKISTLNLVVAHTTTRFILLITKINSNFNIYSIISNGIKTTNLST